MSSYINHLHQNRTSSSSSSITSPIESESITLRRRSIKSTQDADDTEEVLISFQPGSSGSGSSTPHHPLTPDISRTTSPFNNNNNFFFSSDVSESTRPGLRRVTSEIEREVANASVASRSSLDEMSTRGGSLDLLRTALGKQTTGPNEVEVLVHDVKPKESLMGIALLYGIDVATLRKVNKLWASDSVHLRRHLYVPLEACRWAQATESFIRGPGEGQITLVPKRAVGKGMSGMSGFGKEVGQLDMGNGKGKGKEREDGSSALAETFLPSTNLAYGNLIDLGEGGSKPENLRDLVRGHGTADLSTGFGNNPETGPSRRGPSPSQMSLSSPPSETTTASRPQQQEGKILTVMRLPASELAFFPRSKQTPSRSSLEITSSRSHFGSEISPPIPRSQSSTIYAPLPPPAPSMTTSVKTNGTSKRKFTTVSMTPTGRFPSSGSVRKKEKDSDMITLEGLSLGNGRKAGSPSTSNLKQPKDRPFEMTDRIGNGEIALPLSASEKEARRRRSATSWFSVADDGLDPGKMSGSSGWK